jgi:hypothetical protein
MPRQIELSLAKKRVRAVATLLDDEAPRTCQLVWDALPLQGDTYHAKWAGRELYTLVPPLGPSPGEENAVIMPIPGDVLYFDVSPASIDLPLALRRKYPQGLVDLAVFYGRNNLLLGPAGFMPGNLFATITDGLAEYAQASAELFREGLENEVFVIRRVEGSRRSPARRRRPRPGR